MKAVLAPKDAFSEIVSAGGLTLGSVLLTAGKIPVSSHSVLHTLIPSSYQRLVTRLIQSSSRLHDYHASEVAETVHFAGPADPSSFLVSKIYCVTFLRLSNLI